MKAKDKATRDKREQERLEWMQPGRWYLYSEIQPTAPTQRMVNMGAIERRCNPQYPDLVEYRKMEKEARPPGEA